MSGAGPADVDDPDDPELLDLLQSSHDASLMRHMDRDVQSATSTTTDGDGEAKAERGASRGGGFGRTAPHLAAAASPSVPAATAFLVGGSLFADHHHRRRGPAAHYHRGMYGSGVRPTGLRLLDARGRFATMSALAVGSLYCPFTQQFISLSSPHWHHLQSAGFGLDASIQGGRRLALVAAPRLYRFACQLQGRQPIYAHHPATQTEPPPGDTTDVAPVVSPTTTATATAAAACYADRQWSQLLARSLGALLEAAPVGTYTAFHRSISRSLGHECDTLRARVIEPSVLLPPLMAADSGGSEGHRHHHHHRHHRYGSAAEVMAWRQHLTPTTDGDGGGGADFTAAGREALGRFGDIALSGATAWRQHALQWHPKSLAAAPTAPRLLPPPPLLPPLVSPGAAAAATITEGGTPPPPPPLPMPAVPGGTRVAEVTVERTGATAADWEADMAATVRAVLADLQGSLPRRARLYYCPVEHSIDYSGVLDLRAYRVGCGGGGGGGGGCFPSPAAVPLLSLGLEGESSRDETGGTTATTTTTSDTGPVPRVLVVGNGHLLSRRAMCRLFDQWTRNGAAQRALARQQQRHTAATTTTTGGGDSFSLPLTATAAEASVTKRWRLLLRAEPFTSGTRLRYTHPFGPVQALFLSHGGSCSGGGGTAEASPPAPSLFHLQEPLSAALLRYGATAATAAAAASASAGRGGSGGKTNDNISSSNIALSPSARAALLRALCAAAAAQLPGSVVLRQSHSKVAPSGRRIFQAATVPLQSPRGQRTFYRACEELLATQLLLPPPSVPPYGSNSHAGADTDAADADGGGDLAAKGATFKSGKQVEELLAAYPFLSSIQFQHRLVNTYPFPRSGAEERVETPTLSPHQAESVELSVVSGTAALLAREEAANRTLARFARGAVHAAVAATSVGEPRPLLEQRYGSFAEPPLLLGLWTGTLLFCAPAVADVLPLRQHLFERLCGRVAQANGSGGGGSFSAPRMAGCYQVADIDIFHVDFVIFPMDRRCRLFGCRALLHAKEEEAAEASPCADGVGGGGASDRPPAAEALAAALEFLHGLLKCAATEAIFFPLWTYHVLERGAAGGTGTGGGGPPTRRLRTIPLSHATAERGGPPPRRGHTFGLSANAQTQHQHQQHQQQQQLDSTAAAPGPHDGWYRFSSVDEWRHPCPPNLVERRLFALEAAQRPSLHLVVGSLVALYRPVALCGGGVDDATAVVVVIPRGTICRVQGFVSAASVLERSRANSSSSSNSNSNSSSSSGGDGDDTASVPPLIEGRLYASAGHWAMVRQFMGQQRGAVAFPILRPVQRQQQQQQQQGLEPVAPFPSPSPEFVLTPQSSLVGGYRSLHYYSLPVLHLPIHVLVGGSDGGGTGGGDETNRREFFRNRPRGHRKRGRGVVGPAVGSSACEGPMPSPPCMSYPARQLFHPYHADPDSAAFLLLSRRQRSAAHTHLLLGRGGSASGDGTAANTFLLMEDLILTSAEEPATVAATATDPAATPPSPPPLPEVDASGFPLIQRAAATDGEGAADAASVFSCPLLTEVSLFAAPLNE